MAGIKASAIISNAEIVFRFALNAADPCVSVKVNMEYFGLARVTAAKKIDAFIR